MADDGSAQASLWPLPTFSFAVDIPEVETDLLFQEVTGLSADTQTIEYRHGNSPSFYPIKMPGIGKVGNVTLKKGIFPQTDAFWTWCHTVTTNDITRRTITIKLLDQQGQATMTWTLANAWPTKITGMDLKSDGNEVFVDTLEIAHEGVTVGSAST